MKKYISRIIMAVFAFIAILPMQVSAAEDGEVLLKANGNTVTVSVTIPEAVGEQLSSLQLGLSIMGKDAKEETEDPIEPDILKQVTGLSFDFDSGILSKAKITEQRYQEDTRTLRIYIAGTEPLFGENGELVLGTLKVNLKSNEPSGVYVGVEPGSFKKVQGARSVPVQSEEILPDPVLIPAKQTPENPKPGGTGGGSGNQGTDGGDSDKTDQLEASRSTLRQLLEMAAGYREEDYTAESYALLKQAMEEAQRVLDDEEATQEEVERAAEALMNAIGSLMPIPSSSTSVGEGNGQNQSSGGQNSGGQGSSGEKSVKTGDDVSLWIWAAALALSAVTVVGSGLWKRREEQ